MNVRQCVVVNEYGACLLPTLADTPEESERIFVEVHKRSYQDPDATLEGLGCCVVRLVPVVVLGQPHGYWVWQPSSRRVPGRAGRPARIKTLVRTADRPAKPERSQT